MPNTLIEGMASGIPIICSNRGPMPEVLRDGGIYFDPENIDSIVDSVIKIINNKKLRENMVIKSANISNLYSWARCSSETLRFILNTYKRLT